MPVGVRRSFSVGVVSLCVLVGALTLGGVPALAGALQAPAPVTVATATKPTKATVGPPVALTTPSVAPVIEGESVTDVSASSAELAGEIDPGGAETTYHFQYGTTMAYGQSTPESLSIGSDESSHPVTAHIQGLQPATLYHYRVVATNTQSPPGGTPGPDQTFTTQTSGGALILPDGREWEMVSPPVKEGGRIVPIEEESFIQAATNGDAIAYTSFLAPTEPNPAGFSQQSQVFSSRGAGGWSSRDINTPHEEPLGPSVGKGGEYKFFSSDLSLALVEPFGDGRPPLSASATERTPYVRDDAPVVPQAAEQALYGEAETQAPAGSRAGYLPLVTPADVPAGTKFGEKFPGGVNFEGATPDLSHILLESPAALTSRAAEVGLGEGLYEWSGGRLQLVSVMPGAGEEPARGSLGDGELARNAVSVDGSRVFWTGSGLFLSGLFMRDTVAGVTVQVNMAQGVPEPTEPGGARFQLANRDGSKVFFTDFDKLTPHFSERGTDLYLCEMVEESVGKPTCKLTDLTADSNAGEDADVEGSLLGASEDGSYVYFVATGALAEGASSGAENLYVLHNSGGVWTTGFIAKLTGDDYPDWAETLTRMPARVSPDGHYLAFMSDGSPTGYDNLDANSGQPDEEVYLYHAETSKEGRLEPGRLVCASCDPSGARPVGIEASRAPYRPINEDNVWGESQWLAADVPGWVGISGGSEPRYQPRYLSDSGRLFFNSVDPLVPQASNGVADVYEYEPAGDGSCTGSDLTFSVTSGGCVALISGGSSGEESVFLDASENGDDVFFLTSAQLVGQDLDTASDVYDAHVCSATEPCPAVIDSPPPCDTADSCRAAPTPQPAIFGAPASATFSGAGNIVTPPSPAVKPRSKAARCKPGFVRKHSMCVRAKAKRKKAKTRKAKARRASERGARS